MAEDQQVQSEQMQRRMQSLVSQWSQGKVSLKQILGLSENELFAIASQGYFLFLQGKTEDARVFFEGLVALDPRNAYYYRALGTIYWRLKEPQKAIKQFTYALRVAPTDTSTYINRAEIYVATEQFALARSDLTAALQNARTSEEALVQKAQAIMKMIDV